MCDRTKTQDQLVAELEALRAENARLKAGLSRPWTSLSWMGPNHREHLLAGFFSAAIPSNVGLFIVDLELRCLQINPALADLNGTASTDSLGRSLADLLPHLAPTLMPLLQTLLQTGCPISNLELSGYVPCQPGVLRQWLTSCFPITSPTGEILAIGGTLLEISEYKQTIEALRQSEADLRTAQRIAHVGSWCFDCVTCSVFWSEEMYHIHGCPLHQPPPQGEALEQLIHPDDRPLYRRLTQRAILGDSFEVDLRIIRPDGELRYIETRGEPGVFNERGQLVRLFGTVIDVTERKRVEEALRQSELALREAQRLAHVGSWTWNPKTGIVWSEEIYRIHGCDPCTTPPSKPDLMKYTHPDDTAIHESILAATYAGQPYEHDLRIVRPNGEIRYIEARGEPGVRNEQGQLVELFGTVLDVTERKQIEEKLRRNEAEMRAILAAIPDMLIRVRQDGTRLFIATGSLRSYLPTDGLIGRSVYDTLPQQLARQRMEFVQQAIATQQLQVYEYEISIAGETRCEEARIVAINDEEALIVVRDVTDRKRAEATLQESNRRWRSLLDQVQLMVIGLDAQGNVEYFNPFFLQMTGYMESEVMHQPWFDTFVAATERPTSQAHFRDLLEQRLPSSHFQDRILTRSGEERTVIWNNTVLQDNAGQVIGIISMGEDVTERQKLERLKAEFISVVSHELRTPLTSMQVALSLLDEHLVDPTSDDGQSMIHVATAGVDRLVRLVNDILDLERLESGQLRICRQLCQSAELIHTAIEQMKDLANQSNIVFETRVENCVIEADGDRLVQVLTNLLSNAIRFSPSAATVHITVESLSTHPPLIQFKVADRGRGIPADQLERIFERFQQVDASDARQRGGTGLGLAICRTILQQHGGRIWAESTLNQGSTFYFTLPMQEH